MASGYLAFRPQFVAIVESLRARKLDVDRIAYTDVFDAEFEQFQACAKVAISKNEFWWELIRVRKNLRRYRVA